MEYLVESKWTGYWGGWGSEGDIAGIMNARASEGWRLSPDLEVTHGAR